MVNSLDLANKKIAELERRLQAAVAAADTGKLTLLPNGDLHRGLRMEDARNPNIDVTVIEAANPLNRIMAEILLAAKGGHNLTCTRCGLQWNGQNAEKDIREHLKKDHASLVTGWDTQGKETAEILMANLEEAKSRLAEATSK